MLHDQIIIVIGCLSVLCENFWESVTHESGLLPPVCLKRICLSCGLCCLEFLFQNFAVHLYVVHGSRDRQKTSVHVHDRTSLWLCLALVSRRLEIFYCFRIRFPEILDLDDLDDDHQCKYKEGTIQVPQDLADPVLVFFLLLSSGQTGHCPFLILKYPPVFPAP